MQSNNSINYTVYDCTTIGIQRFRPMIPLRYRLGKRADGTIVLQGDFYSTFDTLTDEWEDIPTVDLE